MRPMFTLTAAVVSGVAGLAAAMQPQTQVVFYGNAADPAGSSLVPGFPGQKFKNFYRPVVCPNGGQWTIIGGVISGPGRVCVTGTDNGSQVTSTGRIQENSTLIEYPGRIGVFASLPDVAINNDGRFAAAMRLVGDSADNDVCVRGETWGGVSIVRREGQLVGMPEMTLGCSLTDPGIDTAGHVALRALGTESQGFRQALLLNNGSVAAMTGVTAPEGQSGTPQTWKSFDLDSFTIAGNGTDYSVRGRLNGPSASDQLLYFRGQPHPDPTTVRTISIQEGATLDGLEPITSPIARVVGQSVGRSFSPAWMARGENQDGNGWVWQGPVYDAPASDHGKVVAATGWHIIRTPAGQDPWPELWVNSPPQPQPQPPNVFFDPAHYADPSTWVIPGTGCTVVGGSAIVSPTQNGIDITVTVVNTNPDPATSSPWPEFRVDLSWEGGSSHPLTRYWWARHKFLPHNGPFTGQARDALYGLGLPQGLACNCVAFDDAVPLIMPPPGDDTAGGGVVPDGGASPLDGPSPGGDDTPTPTLGCPTQVPVATAGNYTIGFGTDYPYVSLIHLSSEHPNTVCFVPTFNSCTAIRVIPDYIRGGETRTIRFWLRRVHATGESAACAALQPYVDHIRDHYPADQPPKLRGRIGAINIAQAETPDFDPCPPYEANPRHFNSFPPFYFPCDQIGPRADRFASWSALLDAACASRFSSVSNMHQLGFKAVMCWAASGWTLSRPPYDPNFLPTVVTQETPNLFGTLDTVPTWEATNGLKAMLWAGRAFSAVQPGIYWNDFVYTPLAAGYYQWPDSCIGSLFPIAQPWDPSNWTTWTLARGSQALFDREFLPAADYFSGTGLDACPGASDDPWILDQLAALRQYDPAQHLFSESAKTDRDMQHAETWFGADFWNGSPPGSANTAGTYDGFFEGRCPLLDRIYPNYEDVVPIYWDSSHINTPWECRVRFVEGEGMATNFAGEIPNFTYQGRPEDPVEMDRTAIGNTFFMQVANVYGERVVGGFTTWNRAVWVYNGCGIVLREDQPVVLPNGDMAYVAVPGTTAAELDGKQDAGLLSKKHVLYVVVSLKTAPGSAGTPKGEALLRIPLCPADLNCDGVADAQDLNLFQQGFAAGESWADFNHNGVLDEPGDLNAYLALAAEHCIPSTDGDGDDGIE
jgi:hypothetical protein